MLYLIVLFLACLLAVYGGFSLISGLFDAVRCRNCAGGGMARVIVAVRNTEEEIEYIVRNAVKSELASRLMSDGSIIFVDMDSKDDTFRILQELKKEYANIRILRLEERDEAFSQ